MKNLKIIVAGPVAGTHQAEGAILRNVDNHLAAELVKTGRAEEVQIREGIRQRDPQPENRDPQTSGKKGKDTPAE